jgi:hypothetical protein
MWLFVGKGNFDLRLAIEHSHIGILKIQFTKKDKQVK